MSPKRRLNRVQILEKRLSEVMHQANEEGFEYLGITLDEPGFCIASFFRESDGKRRTHNLTRRNYAAPQEQATSNGKNRGQFLNPAQVYRYVPDFTLSQRIESNDYYKF